MDNDSCDCLAPRAMHIELFSHTQTEITHTHTSLQTGQTHSEFLGDRQGRRQEYTELFTGAHTHVQPGGGNVITGHGGRNPKKNMRRRSHNMLPNTRALPQPQPPLPSSLQPNSSDRWNACGEGRPYSWADSSSCLCFAGPINHRATTGTR